MIRKTFVTVGTLVMLLAGCGSDNYTDRPTIQNGDTNSKWVSVVDPSTNRTFHCLDWVTGTWCYEPSPPVMNVFVEP